MSTRPTAPLLQLHSQDLLQDTHRAMSRGLRSGLVGSRARAAHPRAIARQLGPGLYEQVELETGRRGQRRVPSFEEAGLLGLGPASIHRIARSNTCAGPFEVSITGPRPGTRVWMVGSTSASDAAVVALELPRLIPAWTNPEYGFLFSVPVRGTALYLPLGGDPTQALRLAHRLGDVRAPSLSTPLDVHTSADFMARWAAQLYNRLGGPVSAEIYWVHRERFALVPRALRNGQVELRPGSRVRAALSAAREQAGRGR